MSLIEQSRFSRSLSRCTASMSRWARSAGTATVAPSISTSPASTSNRSSERPRPRGSSPIRQCSSTSTRCPATSAEGARRGRSARHSLAETPPAFRTLRFQRPRRVHRARKRHEQIEVEVGPQPPVGIEKLAEHRALECEWTPPTRLGQNLGDTSQLVPEYRPVENRAIERAVQSVAIRGATWSRPACRHG